MSKKKKQQRVRVQPRMMTLPEAAAYMHVSVRTFRNWRERRIGPTAYRVGGNRLYYDRGELDTYLESKREKAS